MTEAIIEFFRNLLKNDYLTIIIIAILPIIEVRGAIPVAFGMGMKPLTAMFTAFIGCSIVIPFLLLLLRPILNALKKIKFIGRIADAAEDILQAKADKVTAKAKASGKITDGEISSRYKFWGVLLFVAVPLPMTGVWTGSAVAAFLDMKFIPAFISVMLGNLCAAIIMTILSIFFINYLDIILTAFLLLVVSILVFYIITLVLKINKSKN